MLPQLQQYIARHCGCHWLCGAEAAEGEARKHPETQTASSLLALWQRGGTGPVKEVAKRDCTLAGLQVATDALTAMERAMARDGIAVNDRQLACARINSKEGQDYLAAMACAANYAFVNRASMTFLARQAFAKMFKKPPDQLDMHVVYDVSHNIAKVHHSTQQSAFWSSAPDVMV